QFDRSFSVGGTARICVTEMADQDEWLDMPLGLPAASQPQGNESDDEAGSDADSDADEQDGFDPFAAAFPYTDEAGGAVDVDERSQAMFSHGKVMMCRILSVSGNQIEASLRKSRTVRCYLQLKLPL